MYSSRRYYRKSKQYYRKKRINKKFSPSLYKHQVPTYFQQKGRIIQTTPLNIHPIPQSLPNSKTLEKMYNTLIKAKYPGVTPSPSIQYHGWYFNLLPASIPELFSFPSESATTSDYINSTWLSTYVENLQSRPPLPEGYEIEAHVMGISFDFPANTSTAQYHLYWTSPLFQNAVPLIAKETQSTIENDIYNVYLTAEPHDSSHINISYIRYTTQTLYPVYTSYGTQMGIDPTAAYYPLISTSDNPNTTFIQIVRSTFPVDKLPYGGINFFIVYRYIESF